MMGLLSPTKTEPVESPTQVQVMLQMAELLKTIQDNSNASAQQQALLQAEMLVRAMPENKEHPGVSAYSYPEGDKAKPKPTLKCPMYWVGYPLTSETLRPDEINALNILQPGTFTVTKANGEKISFRVEPRHRLNGEIESLSVSFPVKDDQRNDHRSLVDYCFEASGRKVMDREELLAEIAKLRAALQPATISSAA